MEHAQPGVLGVRSKMSLSLLVIPALSQLLLPEDWPSDAPDLLKMCPCLNISMHENNCSTNAESIWTRLEVEYCLHHVLLK